jgi:hypothetical protein
VHRLKSIGDQIINARYVNYIFKKRMIENLQELLLFKKCIKTHNCSKVLSLEEGTLKNQVVHSLIRSLAIT